MKKIILAILLLFMIIVVVGQVYRTSEPVKSGTFAYITDIDTVTCATAETFYALSAAFVNDPIVNFSIGTDEIVYNGGETKYFVIVWHATVSSEDPGRTVHVGISHNGAVLTIDSPSAMGTLIKYSNESITMSGTEVVKLENGDTIQIQTASSVNDDKVIFTHFTTTIRKFF